MKKLTPHQKAELLGDLHVYGGGALASVGVGAWLGAGAGLFLFGTFVAWLGLTVRGRSK